MLPNDLVLEAVRNRKTGKLFIIVDDQLDARYKVVNPAGEIIILPDLLFDEDPVPVARNDYAESFTPEQLAAYESFMQKAAERAAAEAARPRPPVEPKRVAPAPPTTRKAPASRKAKKSSGGRSGVGAAWSSPRLTFYRHKIEPLDARQTFRITIEGGDTYEISKDDFLAHFNDVAMSPSYRSEGYFTYSEVPEKMRKYLRTSG